MRFIGLLALSCALLSAPGASARPYDKIMDDARAAFIAEDWTALGVNLDEALAQRPYSLYLARNRILAFAMTGDGDAALHLLQRIADAGLSVALEGHEGYERVKALGGYAPIGEQMAENAAPAGEAAVHYTLLDPNLLPEAYAYGADGAAYIGSVRTGKILKVDSKGRASGVAFANGGVFDLEPRGDILWAAVNNQLAYEGAASAEPYASVMAFDLATGAPKREIRVAQESALLGDLEVASDGAVFATDSITPRVFRMAPDGETLDVFVADDRFANLQGAALDEENGRLFVADYLAGLFVVDIATGAVAPIAGAPEHWLGGIDGLYLYKGDLVGIQNGTTPQRIVRIALDDMGYKAMSIDVLQQALPEWNEPTHGAVRGDAFHYIATSNWPSYDSEWNVREDANLQPLRVMTVGLD